MRIAVAQMDLSRNQLESISKAVWEAANHKVDFLVLPELANCPWIPATEVDDLRRLAEPQCGPALTYVQNLAAKHRINIIAPIYEANGEVRYSTAFIIDRQGQVVGRYRKNHIPYEPGWYEKFYYGPGNDPFPVFEVDGLRFGVLICWDNMFPETSRILALKGAKVIFSPRATGRGSRERWRSVIQANAAVNHLFVATANRIGLDNQVLFGGDSLVADPFGNVVVTAHSDGSEVVVADLDLSLVDQARSAEPFFENRRPELYGRLTEV